MSKSHLLPEKRAASTVVLLAVLVSCSSAAQMAKEATLPSGKKIKILGVGRMYFTNGSPPALMLKYQTGLKITDMVALEKEVNEIWSVFKADVERAGLTAGMVSANEIPRGNSVV